ncbi:hypothetical protein [Stenotrophomonas sp. AN71]|uniref:hypothetical protein n=1 Tax=Stenotrophomonas sp. AN71 TaxID=3156253 RepID=UPI003D22E32A
MQIQRPALGALLPGRFALVHAHTVAAPMQDERSGQAGGTSADDGDTGMLQHGATYLVVDISTIERSG